MESRMELHSYAKRKTAKKWSTEHKRKLVEARINNDSLFVYYPTYSVVPWKKILTIAKLDDYNVYFVRKQWSYIIAKYKQYKQNRLGNIPSNSIDNEMIQGITDEWEFFKQIHHFMIRKTTNLHSYALSAVYEKQSEKQETNNTPQQLRENQQQQQQRFTSSSERENVFSSDTNEDYVANGIANQLQIRNTDHDFYSKRTGTTDGNPINYHGHADENTQDAMLVEMRTSPIPIAQGFNTQEPVCCVGELVVDTQALETNEQQKPNMTKRRLEQQQQFQQSHPITSNAYKRKPKPKMSEREKYYRHKRRFNRRLEQRFDVILNIFGQIVKAEYPSINVGSLMQAANEGGALFKDVFSSSDDDSMGYTEADIETTDVELEMYNGRNNYNENDDGDDDDDIGDYDCNKPPQQ